jgi:hypothetical protein
MVLEHCPGNTCKITNILTGQEIYAFCNRRRICRRCAETYRYRIARQLDTVQWESHAMLTMIPGEDRPTPVDIRRQSQRWLVLAGLLRKHWPHFYYAWFREIAHGTRLHLHVLWSIPRSEMEILRSLADEAGFGYVDVRSIRRPEAKPQKAVINYVTKSLATICTDPDGAWSIRTRRHQIAAPVSKQDRGRNL